MMKKNKYILALVVGYAIVLLNSCAIPEATVKKAEVNLPASFINDLKDTTTVANVEWNNFFADPYLQDLIDTALVSNKELNILLQRIAISRNEIGVRKGEYLPNVSGFVNLDAEKVGEFTRNGAIEKNLEIADGKNFPELFSNIQVGLVASWELDVWKKLRNSRDVAIKEYMASIEGRKFIITNLVSEIATSYYELIALDNQLVNLRQNIELQQNALEMVQVLKDAGRENSLAVKRFQAEVQKNESEIFNLNQEIIEIENKINFLLGRVPQTIDRSNVDIIQLAPPRMNAGIPSQLLRYRPDIRQTEMELEGANLDIEVARANFYPSFAIRSGLGFEAFNPKYLIAAPESILFSIAGDMMAPLVNRRAIIGAFRNANDRQVAVAYEYEQRILNAYVEVANQLSNQANLDKTFEKKSEQVKSLTESIEIANLLFQSARADYTEVLLTQREALEAKLELIETKKEQFIASVDLYRSLGGGWQ